MQARQGIIWRQNPRDPSMVGEGHAYSLIAPRVGFSKNDGEEGAFVRPKGYYWVRFRDGGWEPAKWDGEAWQVIGIADVYQDDEIPEIGPPIEQPK